MKLSRMYVFSPVRRAEIADAEDAVKAARKSIMDDGGGPILLEVDLIAWQDLAAKQHHLLKLLGASVDDEELEVAS